jgi:GNAT superfamily N-acetyltransferase
MRDAVGIIEVDRATFGDCNYSPEYILALQEDPLQRAWVAQEDGQIVGFVSAFPTHSLAASRWEIDELAVLPAFHGRGIGTALVGRAIAGGTDMPDLSQARALVATTNLSSQRVFAKNGHSAGAEVHLLLYKVTGRVPRPVRADLPAVRAARAPDVPFLADLAGCPAVRVTTLLRLPDHVYLIAEQDRNVCGYVELIHVRTLQYEGFWIESIVDARRGDDAQRDVVVRCGDDVQCDDDAQRDVVAGALFTAAIEEAKGRDTVDEIGYLAPPGARALYTACVGQGFAKIDEYLPYVRALNG